MWKDVSCHDAVLQGDAPDVQWLEEFGGRGAIELRVRCCASWRLLARCIVRDSRGRLVDYTLIGEVLLFRL